MLLQLRLQQGQEQIQEALQLAGNEINDRLLADRPQAEAGASLSAGAWLEDTAFTDPFVYDLRPWILRRLDLACEIAQRIRNDAEATLQVGAGGEPEGSPARP